MARRRSAPRSRTRASGAARHVPRRKAASASAGSTDQTQVIYIHGILPKPPPDVLKAEWDLALFGKLMDERTRLAYWADILHGEPVAPSRTLRTRGERAVTVDRLLEDAGVDPSDDAARTFVEGMAESVGFEMQASRPRGPGKKVIPLPAFLRDPLARLLMQWLIKDTAAYFFQPGVRDQIKKRLRAAIPTGGEPFVLVAHSQGTIVAFEVLSEMKRSQRAECALLVTLGSPLGLQEVQDQLARSKHELVTPPDVRAWHNFSARLDPVCADKRLANDFAPRDTTGPDGERRSVGVKDAVIFNRSLIDLSKVNPHDAVGYLTNPEVRTVVHRTMRFDTAGRFVVARDVAEGFAARSMRQPVLIEVLEPGYWAVGESQSQDEVRKRERRTKAPDSLSERVGRLAREVESMVEAEHAKLAQTGEAPDPNVQELRKYVAADLTPAEIQVLASQPAEYNVYALWRSAVKRKSLDRSHVPLSADAARESYRAAGRGITWAVLDTGCRFDHPHFARTNDSTVVEVLDCTKKGPPVPIKNPKVADGDGHGTHVCGIIAGRGDSEHAKYSGVAPLAKLIVYKVLDEDGEGYDAWIIKAIDDVFRRNQNAARLQIHGVNLSLGGPFDASTYGCGFSPICKELRDLWQQGVLVCVSAGNEGQLEVSTSDGLFDLNTQVSIGDPANLQECVAVGSVHADKPHLYGVSYFSSRGPTADGRIKPDVVAPGERIFSCNSNWIVGSKKETRLQYRPDSGTSMACPHVSGLLAAFLSVRREFIGRPDDVKRILMNNCNDLGRDRYHQGAGIPNLMKMLINT